ncbi:substrate-binding domain-containing protein [Rhizobium halophytocola]|uniref:LacI family fructose operon transcriptional repressor n=1 Tax=Rhizobium halophytocola TaxID=735519 RepID=A0ABS4E0U0_9HYPH|nr:LacI family fructose operon transcriptional repressor [Rhizobium halophytocola]
MNQQKPAKRTTIYDLAELAGTSASAVSAVLNGNWKKRRISSQLAQKISKIAEEQGYSVNMQASLLRREKSKIIGMIVPKYDNRYFGSIVERFEDMARERGLFPIITCTRRDPELEVEAAKTMLSYQVDCLISTGATDPDRITDICHAAGVQSLNLDLPGTKAPSVISDNYAGAHDLTRRVLENTLATLGRLTPLVFVGGRGSDHNTAERIRGFAAAHAEMELNVEASHILACGYAPDRAEAALTEMWRKDGDLPKGMFVNSTISLEGVMRWINRQDAYRLQPPLLGCFDWDPFVALLGNGIEMVRQDVPAMLEAVFSMMEENTQKPLVNMIPPIFGG